MIDRAILTVLLGLLGLGYAIQCPKQKTSPGREVVCYTSVSNVDQLTDSICRCTTLVHQGYDVRNLSTSEFEGFRKSLKEINQPLQFMISIDDPAKTLMTSGTKRQETTARLISILKEVDGVELNMTAGSKERLFHFLKGLKDEMVRKSYDKRLFLVLPTKAEDIAKQFDLKELSKYVDLFTIPTHYLVEDDEAYHTFHPSRLMGLFDMVNTDSLIDLISGLGAPKRKILVSLPARAYRFTLKDQNDNAPRSSTTEKDPMIIDRKQLCESLNKGEWTIERDEDLTAPYAFKNKTWIAFEDSISVGIKGKYALLRSLPGLAIRDIENDLKTKCGKPLTHEVYHSFTDFKRKSRAAVLNALEDDLHQAQITYPNQVKSSDYRVVRVVDTEGHIRVVRENTQTEFTCRHQGYFVHPKSCNRFYRCVKFNQEVENYSVFEFDCPAGLAFDERTEVCVWPGSLPQGSPCPGSSEIAPVGGVRFQCPSQQGYYADPQNGRWFFACIDLGGPELMAYEFQCPYGLVFDERKLVCEWPWLVAGYSENGYTRPEYDSQGFGAGSTQGIGGYGTSGLHQGYSGSTGTTFHGSDGGYSATGNSGFASTGHTASGIGSSGVHSGGSGFSGAAGVGYSGSAGGSHGSSVGGGYGSSGLGQSGSAGSSHGGTISQGYGSTGAGYSGSAGSSHGGAIGQGYGSTGAGYSGSVGGSHGSSIGQGYGSTGVGYSGGVAGSHGSSIGQGYGSTGAGYSGSTGSTHGSAVGDEYESTRTGYSGSAHGSHGSTFGQAHGSSGAGYSGTTSGSHGSSAGQGYGLTGSGHSAAVGGGHGSSISQGYGVTGAGYSGVAGGSHEGSTGQGHGLSTTEYSGTFGGSHGGSAGQGYGASGTGYSGSTGGSHGSSIGQGYGSTGSGYSGTTGNAHTGSISGSFTGSAGSGYTGSSSIYAGSTGTAQSSTGYTGSGSSVQTGSTGIKGGSSGSEYNGSNRGYSGTTFINHDTGAGRTGSTINQYQGSTVGAHGGSSGYAGSAGSGYTGGHSDGAGYSGTSGGYAGSTGGGYVGSTGGNYGSSETHIGLSGIGQTDSSTTGSKGYSGSSHVHYSGSPQSSTTHYATGIDHSGSLGHTSTSGSTYTGSAGSTQSGYSSGTKYTGSSSGGYTGSSQNGFSVPGHTITVGTAPSHAPSYPSSTATGAGHIGSFGVQGQTPGVTIYEQEHEVPSVSYIPSTPGITGHSGVVSTGSLFPGQSGVTTTHFGNAGTGGYGTNGIGTTTYHGHGGIHSGFRGPGQNGDLNITLVGSGVPFTGSTIYNGGVTPTGGYVTGGGSVGTGAIVTGSTIQGSIITDDSSSGTLLTHGDSSGTVLTGSSDQGAIITGNSQPGFVHTSSGTPGYVISEGVKTVYGGSSSPGSFVHGTPSPGILLTGTPAPGTIIRGEASPGVVLSGQTASGVSLGGTVEQGTVVGSTGNQYFTESGGYTNYRGTASGNRGSTTYGSVQSTSVPVSYDTGYKTNEYHDNGGRGTIKFNNGYVTSKYTENDIPDYRPAGVTIPDTVISGGLASDGGVTVGSTASGQQTQSDYYSTKTGSLTPTGFTKTGPTRTGIMTASVGGRGSYVVSTGKPRPTVNPENIGEKAFEGNVAGFTKTSTESSDQSYSGVTSTHSQDVSHVDTSKITLGPGESTGYFYPKPNIQFETGVAASPATPIHSTDGGVITVTTPTPYLNVEVYNTPKAGGFPSTTAAPAVVNGYNYDKPGGGHYQGSTPSRVPVGFNRKPSPTLSPVGYTTGPLENFKTTAFEAARIPVVISTVQPVIDDGYKTVVSPNVIPVTIAENKFDGHFQTGSVSTNSQYDLGAGTSVQQGGFGERTNYGSVPTVTYHPPTVTAQSPIRYTPSTVSPDLGYSYTTSGHTFEEGVTPSSIPQSPKPQTQYLPASSVSPAVGVTYRKPFPIPGISYQPTTPQSVVTPGTSKTYGYSGSAYNGQGFSTQSKTTIESSGGGSPTNLGIPRDEVGKLITNYNRGTMKYIPSQYDTYTGTKSFGTTGSFASSEFANKQSSSSSIFGQTSTLAPFGRTQQPSAVTKYSGVYSRPSSVASYEITTLSVESKGKGKVIVKWSDLHPLLLGKLGAECTCKADPFANLRGPGKKLIASSKGQVDLSNYDESEIYVDLEKDKSYEDGDYITNDEVSSQKSVGVWKSETPAVPVPSFNSQSRGIPSTTYLPAASSTIAPSANFGVRGNIQASSKGGTSFESSSPAYRGYNSGHRSGKNLNHDGPSTNSIGGQGASFDRYGPGGLRGLDETLEGATDCARPGLFRHPNFCNKFYACHWDEWKKKFTLHVFNCPVHLTFDSSAGACNWPSKGPACQDDNLLV